MNLLCHYRGREREGKEGEMKEGGREGGEGMGGESRCLRRTTLVRNYVRRDVDTRTE